MKTLKEVLLVVLGLFLALSFIYGCYWLGKTISYSIFYEDMVQQTISEMVKPEYLTK